MTGDQFLSELRRLNERNSSWRSTIATCLIILTIIFSIEFAYKAWVIYKVDRTMRSIDAAITNIPSKQKR